MNQQTEDRRQESQRFQMKVLANITGVLPLVLLIGSYVRGELGFNPIEAALQTTGKIAVVFLVLTLAITPIRRLFHFPLIRHVRKPLGLYAAFYAVLHFLIFVWWDYGLDFGLIWAEIETKPFIIIGLIALLILLALSVTSFRILQRKIGKGWVRLHRLTYLAGILVIAHFLLAVKGNLLTLQGEYALPLILGAILLALMALRLPFIDKLMK
ncbi:ferric reductase-like transmembrane domain-containing protein [Chloroflexota bacterium]|nr:ferric reductase-like transmembrane domain-containing protein [Chloroflexota bacterium]